MDMQDDVQLIKEETAREILDMINDVCFGDAYSKFRVDKGSYGTRDLIINNIKEKYGIE